jgi:hypothetical protein
VAEIPDLIQGYGKLSDVWFRELISATIGLPEPKYLAWHSHAAEDQNVF